MPFISEGITDPQVLRQAATSQNTQHMHIRPLSLPFVPRSLQQQHGGIKMRTACMPVDYRNVAETIRAIAVRPDDVWVLGYPGSGAAAVQSLIVRLLRRSGDSDEQQQSLAETIEQSSILPRLQRSTQRPTWDRYQRMPSNRPRVMRSQLPYLLLPVALWRQPQLLIVYVHSDADDVAAEYYREYRLLHGYKGTAAEFAALWRNGLLAYGRYTDHIRDFRVLEASGIENVFNVKYNAKQTATLRALIAQVADAVDVELSEDRLNDAIVWLQAEIQSEQAFRNNVAVMDAHWKRSPCTDFVKSSILDLE